MASVYLQDGVTTIIIVLVVDTKEQSLPVTQLYTALRVHIQKHKRRYVHVYLDILGCRENIDRL